MINGNETINQYTAYVPASHFPDLLARTAKSFQSGYVQEAFEPVQ